MEGAADAVGAAGGGDGARRQLAGDEAVAASRARSAGGVAALGRPTSGHHADPDAPTVGRQRVGARRRGGAPALPLMRAIRHDGWSRRRASPRACSRALSEVPWLHVLAAPPRRLHADRAADRRRDHRHPGRDRDAAVREREGEVVRAQRCATTCTTSRSAQENVLLRAAAYTTSLATLKLVTSQGVTIRIVEASRRGWSARRRTRRPRWPARSTSARRRR